MSDFYDAFISYGRADSKTFAISIQQQLTNAGYRIWFDVNDIPLGVDFQHQIYDSIDRSHNFVFIISPHSVHSPYCERELRWARWRRKRIIPLLHIEHIDQATWQQRNPTGSDDEWTTYQTKGLHSSIEHMAPAIRKINWLHFREGHDDFDHSLSELVEIFERHTSYVERHTHWLAKAIAWERHQKRSPYLLIGEERHQAESWLNIRFQKEQCPCSPTDLHCEFITESTKNAHNLMTQVFLTAAESDADIKEKLWRSLMRENFTVWTNTTDIKTRANFPIAIQQGIEEADNVVLLLSPEALQSEYCRQEIMHALSLNKRIIPLLLKKLDPSSMKEMPPQLVPLQFINFTRHESLAHYRKDAAKLVRALRQDITYYEHHKILLAKALKWARQNQNPSLLLRGYNLNHAETWLKIAEGRSQHSPTDLQKRFITESRQHPKQSSLDVFISYSRVDSDFARRLNNALQRQGKTTSFDQECIAAAADLQQEIYRGIEQSDNFLMILSPASVISPDCADEVGHATKFNKRCISVLYQPVDVSHLPPELGMIQWIDFNRHNGDFYTHFSELIRTLDIDRDHVRNHTKWLQRSMEWDTHDRNPDLLLRGHEFSLAKYWLTESEDLNKNPPATDIQSAYIKASYAAIQAQRHPEKRQTLIMQSLLGLVSVVAVVAVGTSVWAIQSRQRAIAEEVAAHVATSRASLALGQRLEALLTSLRVAHIVNDARWLNHTVDMKRNVVDALQSAVYWAHTRNRLDGHRSGVMTVAISPDGHQLISADDGGDIRLWQRDGTPIKTLVTEGGTIWSLRFSLDGQHFAAAHNDGTLSIWQANGQKIAILDGHDAPANDIIFSSDGTMLLSGSADGTVKVWAMDDVMDDTNHGLPRQTITDHDNEVTAIAFSSDGQTLASATTTGTVRLWQVTPDGSSSTLLQRLDGHTDVIHDVAFSPDGQMLATASGDGTVRLWWNDGTLYGTLETNDEVRAVRFSPDGQLIATGGRDETVQLWQITGTLINVLPAHDDGVTAVEFSPDHKLLATASMDGTVRLLDVSNPLVSQWEAHHIEFGSADAGGMFITHDVDGYVRRWNADGSLMSVLPQQPHTISQLALSRTGNVLVTTGDNGPVQVWHPDGSLANTILSTTDDNVAIALSPHGQALLTAEDYGPIHLWKTDGTLISTLANAGDYAVAYAMSPDGQMVATASGYGSLNLWNTDGTLLRTLIETDAAGDRIEKLVFAGDSTLIVGYAGGLVKRWEIYEPNGQPLLDGNWQTIQVSPNGQIIVVETPGKTLRFWSIDGVEQHLIETGHRSDIREVLFHPTSQMIATASYDGTVKLWNIDGSLARAFQMLTTDPSHKAPISDIAFSADGKILAVADNNGRLIVRTLNDLNDTESLIRKGCYQIADFLNTNPTVSERYQHSCSEIDALSRSEWPHVPQFTVPLPVYGETLPPTDAPAPVESLGNEFP